MQISFLPRVAQLTLREREGIVGEGEKLRKKANREMRALKPVPTSIMASRLTNLISRPKSVSARASSAPHLTRQASHHALLCLSVFLYGVYVYICVWMEEVCMSWHEILVLLSPIWLQKDDEMVSALFTFAPIHLVFVWNFVRFTIFVIKSSV